MMQIEKDTFVPLREAFMQASDLKDKYIEIMFRENVGVLCINRETQKRRTMPFKALYEHNGKFWEQDVAWEYFISKEDIAQIGEKAIVKHTTYEIEIAESVDDDEKNENAIEMGFGKDYEDIVALPLEEQVQLINNDNQKLNDLIVHKSNDAELVTETLVTSTKDVALVNHAVLMEAMHQSDEEAKKLTQNLINSTCDMVKSSVHLISEDIFNDDLMNTIVEKSNGTIVHHITRVFLNGLAFLTYYNKLVSTSSAINRLRVAFDTKYRAFYSSLLPYVEIDDLSLERVFCKGMRAISPEFFHHWAVGFLVHDIGKAAAVQYHEGESAYNRDIVVEHVKVGYTSVMNKTNYPREAGLITGYHHEYYGDTSGYGYFRAYLEQYKKANPNAKQDYCIAYEMEPMLDFHAKAYFPAKVLEIVDVYDSVTDPKRVYHKAMTSEDALAMMREEFVEKHPKLDAILFDIFENYMHEKLKAAA